MNKKYLLLINTTLQDKVVLALARDDSLVSKIEVKTQFKHSERLLPGIDKLLKKNKVALQEIKAIGVVRGPGSYTALKIGLTVANVLGFSLKIPIVGVKLSEFKDINDLAKIAYNRGIKVRGSEKIVLPFYGERPYYEK